MCSPRAGVPAEEAIVEEAIVGAQVMHYGGAVVEIAMLVLLGRVWLVRQRRTRRRIATSERPGPLWLAQPAGGASGGEEEAPTGGGRRSSR